MTACDSGTAVIEDDPPARNTSLEGSFELAETTTVVAFTASHTRVDDHGTADPVDDTVYQAAVSVRETLTRTGVFTFFEEARAVTAEGRCSYTWTRESEDSDSPDPITTVRTATREQVFVTGTILDGAVSATMTGCLLDMHSNQFSGTFNGESLLLVKETDPYPFSDAEPWVVEQGDPRQVVLTRQ